MEPIDFGDNATLIRHLKNGDEKAYVFLLETYDRRLYAYALTLIDDYAIAQDIVQNVYVKTWQFRKKLSPKFSIQSFLYKSVYNEFINNYQKNKSMMLLQRKYLEFLNETVENTDDTSISKIIALVTKEVQKLPPKCQKIFHLSKKEGLTNPEIAEYLSVSIKVVEAHITKAYAILRKKMGDKIQVFFLFYPNLWTLISERENLLEKIAPKTGNQ